MFSDSDSSFEFIDSDVSSSSSMEILDDLEVRSSLGSLNYRFSQIDDSEGELSDSPSEDVVAETGDVKGTSESSSGDAVTGVERSDATTKTWQDATTMDLRKHIVSRIVASLSPTTVETEEDLTKLMSFCRSQEKIHFEKAKDREEYYQSLGLLSYRLQTAVSIWQEMEKMEQPEDEAADDLATTETSTSSESADDEKPILEAICGTWKLVVQENVEGFFKSLHGITDGINGIGLRLEIEVDCSNNVLFTYKKAGIAFLTNATSIVPKNLRAINSSQDYIENNQWFTATTTPHWGVKKIENGQLRIECHYGPTFFAHVFDRIQDDVPRLSSQYSLISEAPVEDVARNLDSKTSETPIESETPELQKPSEPISSADESMDNAYGSTDGQKLDALPILQEVIGTWQLVAQENVEEVYKTGVFEYQVIIGSILKLKGQDSCFEISQFTPAQILNHQFTALIAPKNPWPSREPFMHDYVEDNQWFTIMESGRWNKKSIENGQLRIEHHMGPVFHTDVYVRIQDDVLPEPQLPSQIISSSGTSDGTMEASADSTASKPTPNIDIQQSSPNSGEADFLEPTADSRPILQNIYGYWRCVSMLRNDRSSNLADYSGKQLLIETTDDSIKIDQYDGSKLVVCTVVHITPKDSRPAPGDYYHGYIENNQLKTKIFHNNRLDKMWIVNGQLWFNNDNGKVRLVFERTQDFRSKPTQDPTDFIFVFITVFIIVIVVQFFFKVF